MVCNTHSSEFPVAFLSLGPGDSDLLTIKAVRQLKEADIILVPATDEADGQLKSRAAAIISEWREADCIETFCLPMLRNREAVMMVYDKMDNVNRRSRNSYNNILTLSAIILRI